MFKFSFSNYNLLDVAGAALNVAARLRERHPGDPVMLARAERLEATARPVITAYEGVDTRPATADVIEKDNARDDDFRVIEHVLLVHMMSPLHAATAPAAAELHRLLFGEGLDFLNAPFSVESARLVSLFDQLEAKADLITAVGLTPYVARLRASHQAFEAAREQRGELRAAKPDVVGAVRAPLVAAVRATILLLSEPAHAEHAVYVLEPLASLRPKTRPSTPAAPTPV